eukprot:TRINITY_DN365_c0_g1_i3.p2 TRINITY_DN365_c0_g1~~TRINITY_DN365_c0_g1_i3.p2  ORF type:complete len:121 (-),score=48.49 TRINITY_DN365_c0_g1_i3:245-577(-)
MGSAKLEAPIAALLLGVWVASSAILSSYRTAAVMPADGNPIPAAFHGSPGFFASWVATVLAASLLVNAGLAAFGIGTVSAGSAAAAAAAAPVKAGNSDEYGDDAAAATYA